jgi:DNA-binding MarR family transcriptional regulator
MNINADQTSDPGAEEPEPAASGRTSTRTRAATTAEVIDELTAWNPRERMGMFRKWLAGSLSIVHLHVLTILEAGGPLPMGRLADALDVSVASATGIVDRMEQRGLVERRDDDRDRRIVVVHPAPAGLDVFRDLGKHRRAALQLILERLTDHELQSFLVGLRAMRVAREAVHAEAAAADPAHASEGEP